jgi:hypothetical protein
MSSDTAGLFFFAFSRVPRKATGMAFVIRELADMIGTRSSVVSYGIQVVVSRIRLLVFPSQAIRQCGRFSPQLKETVMASSSPGCNDDVEYITTSEDNFVYVGKDQQGATTCGDQY